MDIDNNTDTCFLGTTTAYFCVSIYITSCFLLAFPISIFPALIVVAFALALRYYSADAHTDTDTDTDTDTYADGLKAFSTTFLFFGALVIFPIGITALFGTITIALVLYEESCSMARAS